MALIALDNQAAIAALTNRPKQLGQYIVDAIHKSLCTLRRTHPRMRMHVEWTPGHSKIAGNELADAYARAAAEGARSPLPELPWLLHCRLPTSVAAIKANRKWKLIPAWAAKWKQLPRHAKMSCVDPSLPSHKAYRTLTDQPRRDTSILMQLWSGHISLNMFLNKIRAFNSALCPHCASPESVSHFLLHCHRYTSQRRRLRYKVGAAATYVLWLLSEAEVIPHMLHYIADTRRFDKYLHVGSNELCCPLPKSTDNTETIND